MIKEQAIANCRDGVLNHLLTLGSSCLWVCVYSSSMILDKELSVVSLNLLFFIMMITSRVFVAITAVKVSHFKELRTPHTWLHSYPLLTSLCLWQLYNTWYTSSSALISICLRCSKFGFQLCWNDPYLLQLFTREKRRVALDGFLDLQLWSHIFRDLVNIL